MHKSSFLWRTSSQALDRIRALDSGQPQFLTSTVLIHPGQDLYIYSPDTRLTGPILNIEGHELICPGKIKHFLDIFWSEASWTGPVLDLEGLDTPNLGQFWTFIDLTPYGQDLL